MNTSSKLRKSIIGVVASSFILMPASGAFAGEADNWRDSVDTAVEKNMKYPKSAKQKEDSVTAKMKVTVYKDGTVSAMELVESTGNTKLDREAYKTIERVGSFPEVTFSDATSTTFIVELHYTMAQSGLDKAKSKYMLDRKGYMKRTKAEMSADIVMVEA